VKKPVQTYPSPEKKQKCDRHDNRRSTLNKPSLLVLNVVTAKLGDVSSAIGILGFPGNLQPSWSNRCRSKDRAIESLMYPGGQFVLNILADGNHMGLMKHFLKPFAPGEDRSPVLHTNCR